MIDRPTIVQVDHLSYLDELRESGVTNMFGAGAYVQQMFCVSEKEANTIVKYWMQTFTERHPEERK